MRNFFFIICNGKLYFRKLIKILSDRRFQNFLLLFCFLFCSKFLFENYLFNFFDFCWINFIGLFLGYGIIFFWNIESDFLFKIFKFCVFFISLKTIAIYHLYSIFIIFSLLLFLNNVTNKRLNFFFNRYICLSSWAHKFVLYLFIYNFLEVLICYGFGFKFLLFIGFFLSFFVTLL